jgi:hypothetical protein
MSTFPDTPLTDRIQRIILETFEISESAAHDHAVRLGALAECWGDPQTSGELDWTYRVRKDLGKRFKWRSETERESFEVSERQKFAAYEGYIKNQKSPPHI